MEGAKWFIVAIHRPLYVSSWPVSGSLQVMAAKLRSAFESILVENGVDLVLAGHHHSYQVAIWVLRQGFRV